MAILGFSINEGHFGDVSLDGVKTVWIVRWPGVRARLGMTRDAPA